MELIYINAENDLNSAKNELTQKFDLQKSTLIFQKMCIISKKVYSKQFSIHAK